MHIKYFLLISFFCTTHYIFSSEQFVLTKPTGKTWKDVTATQKNLPEDLLFERSRKARKLVIAQIQALRNAVIIKYPTLFTDQEYHTLEAFVFKQAKDLNIPHKESNYLINFNSNLYHSYSGNIAHDIAQCYGKYADRLDALPERIKNHKEYAKYNEEEKNDSSDDDW